MEDIVALLQKDPDEYSEKDLSDETILQVLAHLKAHWVRPMEASAALVAAERFGVKDLYLANELMPVGPVGLETLYKKVLFALTRLEMQLYMRHIVDVKSGLVADDVMGFEYKRDLRETNFAVTQMYRALRYDLLARKSLDPSWATECGETRDYLVVFDETRCTEYHVFLKYLLEKLQESGYARYQGNCYEQIISPAIDDGNGNLRTYNTHAWKLACTVEEFVTRITNKEDVFEQWRIMTLGGNLNHAVSYLRDQAQERQFPVLLPDRHWHSFLNGIYHTSEAKFYKYGDRNVPSHVVSCKFHDVKFDTNILTTDWDEIATPGVDRILWHQLDHLKDEAAAVVRWVYIFMGRTLFELGEHENWQVILFCMGRAGTGKSKLLDAVTSFFNDEDIAVLANNSAKDFGLETFVGKMAWVCYEVKHDFTLDQANFQSMVTGEKVVIQRKNKEALSILWKIPGLLAGNEVASWTDNSGSIARRIVMLRFEKMVVDVDPNLDAEIKRDIGSLLHKCCKAYLDASGAFGHCDVWKKTKKTHKLAKNEDEYVYDVLPKYFHDSKDMTRTLTNPMAAFLRNGCVSRVNRNLGLGMPWDRFKALANEYFEKNNFKKYAWRADKYVAILEDFGIKVEKLDAQFIQSRGKPMEYNGMEYEAGVEWAWGATEMISDAEEL